MVFLELDKTLSDCVERKIPVISVVSIQGSTEFGAMDPLEDIIILREKYMKKVNNSILSRCTFVPLQRYARNFERSRRGIEKRSS